MNVSKLECLKIAIEIAKLNPATYTPPRVMYAEADRVYEYLTGIKPRSRDVQEPSSETDRTT